MANQNTMSNPTQLLRREELPHPLRREEVLLPPHSSHVYPSHATHYDPLSTHHIYLLSSPNIDPFTHVPIITYRPPPVRPSSWMHRMKGSHETCKLPVDFGVCGDHTQHLPSLKFNRWYFRLVKGDGGQRQINRCRAFKWQGLNLVTRIVAYS